MEDNERSAIVYFRAGRSFALRFMTVVCAIPVPLTLWLLTLPTDWDDSPLGPSFGWLIPASLLGLAALFPAMPFFLHDRYVLELTRLPSGQWLLRTFLVWGWRTRTLDLDAMPGAQLVEVEGRADYTEAPSVNAPYLAVKLANGKGLIFDEQCEAPQGWDALRGVLGREKKPKIGKKSPAKR